MPIELDKLPASLVRAAETGSLVPFVGAGVSRQAQVKGTKAFPNWTEMLHELIDLGEEEGDITAEEKAEILDLIARGKFLMAAQAVRSAITPDAFETYIQSRFAPADARPGKIHQCLFKLQPTLVLTTNYDRLLEDAYSRTHKMAPETVTWKDAAVVQRHLQSRKQWPDRPLIFKLHGSTASPGDAILAELDYRHLLYREPGYRMVLSAIFLTRVVLMIGFSFADPELMTLVEALREAMKHGSSPDYLVLPKGEKGKVEKRRLRDDFGIRVIEYEASPGHPELIQLIEYLAQVRASKAKKK